MQLLSEDHFQQPRVYVGHLQSGFSRAASRLSDNQPCLLQNTPPIRQPRLYIGNFCHYLHFPLVRDNSPSTAAAPHLGAAVTLVCRGKSPFFTLFARLSSPFPSANLVAELAEIRHKTRFSATKLAHLSRVVAVSDHFCQRRRCRHNKKATCPPIRLLSFVFILNSVPSFVLYSIHSLANSPRAESI